MNYAKDSLHKSFLTGPFEVIQLCPNLHSWISEEKANTHG